jgi:hypothetical protein
MQTSNVDQTGRTRIDSRYIYYQVSSDVNRYGIASTILPLRRIAARSVKNMYAWSPNGISSNWSVLAASGSAAISVDQCAVFAFGDLGRNFLIQHICQDSLKVTSRRRSITRGPRLDMRQHIPG